MDQRTIALHGGGDLQIGGGPPIDGVLHIWIYEVRDRAPYCFMLSYRQARELVEGLRAREVTVVRTFTGHVQLSHTADLATLRFFAWEEEKEEKVCRLYDAAIYAAADALGEACEEAADAAMQGVNSRRRLTAIPRPAR